ncbi:Thioredoxin 1 [Acaryochloris thomasi RCC1774]|uniref:Thioredoxin n=1 Tax=Acaryochloris thomasi RCC1774 TaxID=1764569 RepID=A0A2W1JH25_9CYAN|nr:thioredoxin domain-containing protein [Acaryochloris thomasi]PZD72880.1 Thioredoxin 1 [Acaryochloris thomasi RCC1774]
MVLSVNEHTFKQAVLEADGLVLVSFGTPWCGPCRILSKYLNRIDEDATHQMKVVQVNADENFKLAHDYRLKQIPTLILFDQGEVIQRIETFESRTLIREQLQAILEQVPHSA